MDKYYDLDRVENYDERFMLRPKDFSPEVYYERVDRNVGWLTRREQELLRYATVGIAGCGGMGGLLAATLLRAGVGHLKIADLEVFDHSNINRQFAANQDSVGLPKVIETARMLRQIASDTNLYVYPEGISEETAEDFAQDCDVICDEIEFWAVASRLALHDAIGNTDTVILNGNSVGMGTRLFRFTAKSEFSMSNLLMMNLGEASILEQKIREKTATPANIQRVQSAVLTGLVPEIPEYIADPEVFSTADQVVSRLMTEGKAPIVASNPPMATGFLANHVLLEILRQKSPLKRRVTYPPDMPGYLFFDAATMEAKVVEGTWW